MKLREESLKIGEQASHIKSREAGVKADIQIARSLSLHSSDCRRHRGRAKLQSQAGGPVMLEPIQASGLWSELAHHSGFSALRKH